MTDEKPKEARLIITLPDGRTFNSAALIYDDLDGKPAHVRATHYGQWLRIVANEFERWIVDPNKFDADQAREQAALAKQVSR